MITQLILGTLLGTFAGFLPGLHTNNIVPMLIMLPLANQELFILTAATAASFTVSSAVPSIIIGAPSGENMSVLPGHRLFRKGKAATAVQQTLQGSLTSIALTPLIAIVFLSLAHKLYPVISLVLPIILVIMTLILIKNPAGLIVSTMAAVLGLTCLKASNIMPMLTGFFGISTLITALLNQEKQEIQEIKAKTKASKLKTTRSAALSTVISSFFGTIPAVSSAITATVGKAFGKMKEEEYLSFIGASNTTYVTISFLMLAALGKARSGATAALSSTSYPVNTVNITVTLMASASIAYIIVKKTLPVIMRKLNKMDSRKLTQASLMLLVSINLALTDAEGLLVLLTATAIGMISIKTSSNRVNCMSSLTIPTAILLLH